MGGLDMVLGMLGGAAKSTPFGGAVMGLAGAVSGGGKRPAGIGSRRRRYRGLSARMKVDLEYIKSNIGKTAAANWLLVKGK